jgi:hypothetical protein
MSILYSYKVQQKLSRLAEDLTGAWYYSNYQPFICERGIYNISHAVQNFLPVKLPFKGPDSEKGLTQF